MSAHAVNTEGRHPATQQIARWFDFNPQPEDLAVPQRACAVLAQEMVDGLPDGPELTAGLRKLLEARECFTRSAMDKAT